MLRIAVLLLSATLNAQSLFEPSKGMYFGAHLDTSLKDGKPNDTPVAFNNRLGIKGSMFEFAEDFPLDFNNPPPISLITDTNSDAFLYLSIYIPKGYAGINNGNVDDLIKQLAGIAKTGRRIFLRVAPEMNGSWQPYGQQPTAFLALWKSIYQAVQANSLTKGSVALLWAPSYGRGYPYPGQPYSVNSTSNPDFKLLDTNNDGKFDASDDPYSPYWPGNDYVDWVGLSTYYFGRTYPWINNELPPDTAFVDQLTGANGNGNSNFYNTYSATGGQKPFMITECGAAFHVSFLANATAVLSPGPGELAIKQAYWKQFLTNPDLQKSYPKIKAAAVFEYLKPEELTLRDFRVTANTLDAFKTDFNANMANYIFAKDGAPTEKASAGAITLSTLVVSMSILVSTMF